MFNQNMNDLIEMAGYSADHKFTLFQEKLKQITQIVDYNKVFLYYYYTMELRHYMLFFDAEKGLAIIQKLNNLFASLSPNDVEYLMARRSFATESMEFLPVGLTHMGFFFTKAIELAFTIALLRRKFLTDASKISQIYNEYSILLIKARQQNDPIILSEFLTEFLIFIELVDPFNPTISNLYDELLAICKYHSSTVEFFAADTVFKTSRYFIPRSKYMEILQHYTVINEFHDNINLYFLKRMSEALVHIRLNNVSTFLEIFDTLVADVMGELSERLLANPMYALSRYRVVMFYYYYLPFYTSHKGVTSTKERLFEIKQLIIPDTMFNQEIKIMYQHLETLLEIQINGIQSIDFAKVVQKIMNDVQSNALIQTFSLYRTIDFIHIVFLALSNNCISSALCSTYLSFIDYLLEKMHDHPFISYKLKILQFFLANATTDILSVEYYRTDFLLPDILYNYKMINDACDFTAVIPSNHLNIFELHIPELFVKLMERDYLSFPNQLYFTFGYIDA